MIVTVKKTSTHQWAGQTLDVPDGLAASMIRRGIATAGAQLDKPPAKDEAADTEKATKKK